MVTTALAGLGFGLGLIVAIGAQNAFVLRQGLRREHVGVVIAICALSDLVLIGVGTAGVGGFISSHPVLLRLVTLAGAAVLLGYAVLAARRAWRPEALEVTESGACDVPADGGPRAGVAVATKPVTAVALTALALTWLNPHVYLDTVVLLGSVSASYAQPWVFAGGAMAGSILWFSALGLGARALAPVFQRPTAWRVFDSIIALVMATLAIRLLLDLAG
ncbi:LysE/ArgO family amino acid transporter [Serinibacter salmoneus]|uniref:L-lysine exporter family protein LysE/ArgO n=1 Tax=Serinibacter salmoneus TaxID=556530 RepID=A0A2A9CWG6_9MICO|nr:LysE/ArgO family amino acid transporter [Serinibacter salmoneus]PFG18481.1 L-lysine exporter family protein LysE/ArgO [Serinibacter salmoneus]